MRLEIILLFIANNNIYANTTGSYLLAETVVDEIVSFESEDAAAIAATAVAAPAATATVVPVAAAVADEVPAAVPAVSAANADDANSAARATIAVFFIECPYILRKKRTNKCSH